MTTSGLTGGGVASEKFVFQWLASVFWMYKCFIPQSYSCCIISVSAKLLDLAPQWRDFYINSLVVTKHCNLTAVTHTSCLWFILLYREGLHLPFSHNLATASPSVPYALMQQTQLTSWSAGHQAGASTTLKFLMWLVLRRKVHHVHAQERNLEGSGSTWIPTVRWTCSACFSSSLFTHIPQGTVLCSVWSL